MTAKSKLVNNGLPEGLKFWDLKVGDIVLVKWLDAEPSHAILLDECERPKTYKGHVTFKVLTRVRRGGGGEWSIEGDQIIRRTNKSVLINLQDLDDELTEEERDIRTK
jgi:hypothetical protein